MLKTMLILFIILLLEEVYELGGKVQHDAIESEIEKTRRSYEEARKIYIKFLKKEPLKTKFKHFKLQLKKRLN